ncbi:hypothetical protein NKG94_36855 [Micromonospora sp. M12]
MERHDPASILVNAARIGHTAFDTPLAPCAGPGPRRSSAARRRSGRPAGPGDHLRAELFPSPPGIRTRTGWHFRWPVRWR